MLERAERKNHAPRIAELTKKLATPPFPPALHYVWKAFFRMRRRKGAGFSGPAPLEWSDFDAFVRRSGLNLSPWEVELLERLDDLYLAALAAQSEQDANPNNAEMADIDSVRDVLSRGHERRIVKREGGAP
jgi:hypothetical protein